MLKTNTIIKYYELPSEKRRGDFTKQVIYKIDQRIKAFARFQQEWIDENAESFGSGKYNEIMLKNKSTFDNASFCENGEVRICIGSTD